MVDRRLRPPAARRRARRALIGAVAACASIGFGLAVPASADPSPTPTAHPMGTVRGATSQRPATTGTIALGSHYARIEPVCRAAKAGDDSCMALRRVDVAKGAAGAVAVPTMPGAHGPHHGYSPADLARVYKLRPNIRTNAVVAVIDAYNDPRVVHELNDFDRHYGMPIETRASFRRVNQAGGSVLPRTDWGWATEIALDVQAVRGVCHHCKILLVEAKDAATSNLAKAVNTAVRLGADIVSNSYGGPEQGLDIETKLAYRHPGVVITAATGDDGWYDWDFVNAQGGGGNPGTSDNMPNAPASLPSVVAVGGTSLTLHADGTRASETVWNDSGKDDSGMSLGASGGGCSTKFRAPAWQAAVAGYAKTGCGSRRMAGDVSVLGDPATGFSVYAPSQVDPTQDGWQVIGGTSLSAPLIAGMYGLVGGSGGVRYPAQSLYLNYKYHPGWAYDVRTGGNSFCGGDSTDNCSAAVRSEVLLGATGNPNNLQSSDGQWLGLLDCAYAYDGSEKTVANNTQCNAAPGYDGPSGVGTPNGARLLRSAQPSVRLGHARHLHAFVPQVYGAVHFFDTIGTPVRYAFHWGDHTPPTIGRRRLVKHSFPPGKFQVYVTVWDSLGRRAVAGELVHVS